MFSLKKQMFIQFLLIVAISACNKRKKEDDDEIVKIKTVTYRLEALDTTRSTVTVTGDESSTLYENLKDNSYHIYFRAILGEELPYTYVRVSRDYDNCKINDTRKYIPEDGEYIIATTNPGELETCPNRINMTLEWDLKIPIDNNPTGSPISVYGKLLTKTVQKPLLSIMFDLQDERHFNFTYKNYATLGALIITVDGVSPPIHPNKVYSSYSFYLMKRLQNGTMCGLTLGSSSYIPDHEDNIVIILEQWKSFRYISCK